MLKTIEGVVDEQNNIRLLEDVTLKPSQRVLVTILDADSSLAQLIARISEPDERQYWLRRFDQIRERVVQLKDGEALSEEDVQDEVNAYRREKRNPHASGS